MENQKIRNFKKCFFILFSIWFSIEKHWDFFEIFSKIFKNFGENLTFSLIIGSSICKKINHVEWWDLTKTQVYFCHPGNCSTDYIEMFPIYTIFLTDRSSAYSSSVRQPIWRAVQIRGTRRQQTGLKIKKIWLPYSIGTLLWPDPEEESGDML